MSNIGSGYRIYKDNFEFVLYDGHIDPIFNMLRKAGVTAKIQNETGNQISIEIEGRKWFIGDGFYVLVYQDEKEISVISEDDFMKEEYKITND